MTKDIKFELDIVKALSTVKSGDRVVCGYASTFDVDTDDMQITRTALEKAKNDLLKYSTVLFNHDMNRPIGKVVETSVDDIGLFVKIVLSKTEEEIWKKLKEGIISKFSIKGRVTSPEVAQPGSSQLTQVNDIELFEVSLATVPANVEAQTICYYIAKSLKESQESSKNSMLIEKLNELLGKEDVSLREGIANIVKDIEKQENDIEDLAVKLQIISGKLGSEDKVIVENAIALLKKKKETPECSCSEQTDKIFDFSDESDVRPVFQLSSKNETKAEENETNKFRKQILKIGKWFHWDADGGILNITDETIDNIIKNFKKKVIENVFVPLTHTNDPSKNAGEIVTLEKTAEGLDAVIEIKDESIAEKIKKGLIKCVSASLDPNYRNKKTNTFAGPTLLHAALVSEPYIKGMGSFIPLAEEFANRPIIQLEDEKPNFNGLYKSIEETMKNIQDKIITEDRVNEIFVELQLKKSAPVAGDECTMDSGEKGTMKDENGTLVCKALTNAELDVIAKNAYTSCIGTEMKAGKTMAEAAKTCKEKVKKDLNMDILEEDPEKSGDGSDKNPVEINASEEVDLADAEKAYEKYLSTGKIIPAQKEAFMQLYRSRKVLELGDKKVEFTELFEQFMKGQPKIVNFDENGTQGGEQDNKKDNEDNMPDDVKTFFGKMGLSDEGVKESWKYAQELKKQEEDEKKSTLF
jgi:hypothetical protein